jgi:hypothetical protein
MRQIGTASTGIQAAPVIAESAAHLTVFQRTANYSVPARNAPLTPEFQHWVKENFEEIRGIAQSTVNGHAFRISERKVADVTPAEREAIYRAAWEYGGLQFRATFFDLLTDRAANSTAAEFLKARIRAIVSTRQSLPPTIGCVLGAAVGFAFGLAVLRGLAAPDAALGFGFALEGMRTGPGGAFMRMTARLLVGPHDASRQRGPWGAGPRIFQVGRRSQGDAGRMGGGRGGGPVPHPHRPRGRP